MTPRAAFFAAALLTLVASAPAAAVQPAEGSAPARSLYLAISGSERTWSRSVILDCPPGAEPPHPRARAACDAITWARGDLDALRGEPHACTMELDPVTVSATGRGQSAPKAWRKTYANACVMDATTGPVFRF
ncbi:SSI family serine proteinase inhibitor [Streptomyces sp. H27-C3]|uniref:SSI family serine proteinase inhibitor n=1 Tax=Streptomyces sp. H27-C3 TaxID=3046305 RepID=UPI0024BB9884|nr:SSI family serine proteinase inhibitor [Streptomyces sp. H27-C3]MDJ0463682.1 SSI family serine proteinase inhibitor [Streptomyces sp. H27-C3]